MDHLHTLSSDHAFFGRSRGKILRALTQVRTGPAEDDCKRQFGLENPLRLIIAASVHVIGFVHNSQNCLNDFEESPRRTCPPSCIR